MAQLPFSIGSMLQVAGVRPQLMQAVEELTKVLQEKAGSWPGDPRGRAYETCFIWQRRFESALRTEIPDWVGLAAFRCITDFTIPEPVRDELRKAASATPNRPTTDSPKELSSLEECDRAYTQYLDDKRDLYSGKFSYRGPDVEAWFLNRLEACEPLLGGQAGNILWAWHCIGAQAVAYVPYFSSGMARVPEKLSGLGSVKVLHFEDGKGHVRPLKEMASFAGLRSTRGERAGAPSGGSMIGVKDGRRIIFQFPGFRVLGAGACQIGWKKVQFYYEGEQLLEEPLARAENDVTWPALPLFCECTIESESETLEVRLASPDDLVALLAGRVDFAVLGGIEALFYPSWAGTNPQLQARLLAAIAAQLGALSRCGVRIGVELSGVPGREYATFIQRLCRQGIIVALGINGVDELPDVVGPASLESRLYEFWLDPQKVPEGANPEADHFEYVTYLRARKLAEATGVRSLYVHTLTLDLILRRDADPGALLRAQLGDMMGKGLVIAALLQRSYRASEGAWLSAMRDKMPPAPKPEAMARLGAFALDLEKNEGRAGAAERLLASGYWIAPSPEQYSVAVVPVMWPPVSDASAGSGLPDLLNPTGSGDMTFGTFFFLGGV